MRNWLFGAAIAAALVAPSLGGAVLRAAPIEEAYAAMHYAAADWTNEALGLIGRDGTMVAEVDGFAVPEAPEPPMAPEPPEMVIHSSDYASSDCPEAAAARAEAREAAIEAQIEAQQAYAEAVAAAAEAHGEAIAAAAEARRDAIEAAAEAMAEAEARAAEAAEAARARHRLGVSRAVL